MAMWNPWRGCHRRSEGCKYCMLAGETIGILVKKE
jgi:protein gp37